ncbi:hypothetical protein EAF04_005290 [Stromatinia cepivora]|nr:hypothetical protein EAF04_005290 [Stromatinia cepivora]
MEGSASRIAILSDIIASNTAKLDKYLQINEISQPSLDENCLDSLHLPRDIHEARAAIVDATSELRLICLGPREALYSRRAHELVSLHFVSSFDVPSIVPVSGSATFAEIASQCQPPVSKEIVKRLLRHSMMGGVFKEHENEVVSHTASSRLMAEDSSIRDWVKLEVDGVWGMAANIVPALKKWPDSSDPRHTAFSLAAGTPVPFYEAIGRNIELAKRFGSALVAEEARFGLSPKHLFTIYPWYTLPHSSIIVDIGGSTGNVSLELASALPDRKLKFVVQDRKEVISLVDQTAVLADLKSGVETSVEFMEHDFFKPQPVKCADVYLLRLILHNWSDNDCLQILRNLVPALKYGSKILVNEIVMPDWRDMECKKSESNVRLMDIFMLMLFNSQERDLKGWQELFTKADPRYCFNSIKRSPESFLSVIEFVWGGEADSERITYSDDMSQEHVKEEAVESLFMKHETNYGGKSVEDLFAL